MSDTVAPLRGFVTAMTRLVERTSDESRLLGESRLLLARLIEGEAWLAPAFAVPRSDRYAQTCCIAIRSSDSRWSASSGVRAI